MGSATLSRLMIRSACAVVAWVCAGAVLAAPLPTDKLKPFLRKYCVECHDETSRRSGLDLEALSRSDVNDAETLRLWVRVFDRVEAGEMPPRKQARPEAAALKAFLADLGEP